MITLLPIYKFTRSVYYYDSKIIASDHVTVRGILGISKDFLL